MTASPAFEADEDALVITNLGVIEDALELVVALLREITLVGSPGTLELLLKVDAVLLAVVHEVGEQVERFAVP